jgi:hypothetical protein
MTRELPSSGTVVELLRQLAEARAEVETGVERLQGSIDQLIKDRDSERNTYNKAIAGHLADIERLSKLWVGETRENEQLRAESEQMRAALKLHHAMAQEDIKRGDDLLWSPAYQEACEATQAALERKPSESYIIEISREHGPDFYREW